MAIDYEKFRGTLPYSAEVFGVTRPPGTPQIAGLPFQPYESEAR
jgi:hypothetical protein